MFPPITNRNFKIDLYAEPTIGSPQYIAMAGAINSVANRFGWLRLRGGTYLEPSRVPQTDARWHATGGFEVRVIAFHLLGQDRRVQISGAGDVASRYRDVALAIGLWD